LIYHTHYVDGKPAESELQNAVDLTLPDLTFGADAC